MKLKESAQEEEELEEEAEESAEVEEPEAEAVEVPAAETDNVGDASVEINVEELIHELEVDDVVKGLGKEQAAKKRLEDLMERKRAKRELEDFDDYEV